MDLGRTFSRPRSASWLGVEPRAPTGILLLIHCTARTPAADTLVTREVSALLERRARMAEPPVSLAVSEAVALGIAHRFSGPTATGQVMAYFVRTGCIDSNELIQAARFEQGYASPEGHAALHCLIGWARSREHRSSPSSLRA
jgi:hypothetical protein